MKMAEQKISKKMKFSELLEKHPETVEILFQSGMHCIGCPMSRGETIEQGALSHGINPDKLVEKLNKKLNSNKK